MTTRRTPAPAEQLGLVGHAPAPDLGYRCLAADPPWQEKGGSRGADKHYPLVPTADIPRVIMQSPLWRPADNAHLWLWVTANFLKDGIFVMEALGFRYVSFAVWVKPSIGIGQYIRLRHEPILFGVRGRLHTQDHGVDSVFEDLPDDFDDAFKAPRGRHSEKPDESYRRIERVSPGPRAEFFARTPREGWDVWGNDPAVASEVVS